jgi:hypothetical protein
MDCDQTVMGLPPVTLAVFLMAIYDVSANPSGIKREWYVFLFEGKIYSLTIDNPEECQFMICLHQLFLDFGQSILATISSNDRPPA